MHELKEIVCQRCGRTELRYSLQTRYCTECRPIVKREQRVERQKGKVYVAETNVEEKNQDEKQKKRSWQHEYAEARRKNPALTYGKWEEMRSKKIF